MHMKIFRKAGWMLLVVALAAGCGKKKKVSLSGDELVEVSDLIAFFPPATLPYQVNDTLLRKKEKDSLLISYNNFARFIPDSVIKKLFGKNTNPKIYADGKVVVPGGETYLFARTVNTNKKNFLILAFDKSEKFMALMTVLQPDLAVSTAQSFSMDRKYTINKTITRKNPDGTVSEGKDVYVLNGDSRSFLLIMTDALDEKVTELINPIDTLPAKHKYSADYSNGKMNLVSIRDGRKSDRLTFFIHIEKNKGECTGELKGEALFRKPNLAEYREDGDPCVLQFIFSSSAVSLKEIEGCGSRRGLTCTLDGSLARKKNVKPARKSANK